MITYLLNTLVDSIKTSLINKLGLDPSTEVDLDDFPQLIDDIPILDSVEELTVTENGTYTGTEGVTYNPVNVNLPLGSKSVTANGTYTASDDSLQGYSSVTVDIDDTDLYRDTTDSTYESVKTLSNCGAFPMSSLKVGIEPQQDLHGYDAPWAGGANYNQCPEEWVTFGSNGLRSSDNFDVQPETEYYYCSPVATQIYYRDADGNNISGITNPQVIGSNTTFTTPSGCYKILLVLQNYGTTYNNDVAVNYPSSITTYSPYSNICPITGWDSIDVYQSGKNIANPTIYKNNYVLATDGTENSASGYLITAFSRVRDEENISILFTRNGSDNLRIGWYDKDGNFISRSEIGETSNTMTTPSNAYYFRLSYNYRVISDIIIAYGTTATPYEAYNGQTYTTALSTTCYGATKELISGAENITHGHIASYNGETLPSTWISDRDEYAEGTTPTIGAEVVYELATPTTATSDAIDLTLAEGVNNLWANSGDVGDVRYFKIVEL